GVVASPSDLEELDPGAERDRLERALDPLRQRGLVELTWLPGQTWSALQEATWNNTWHVFHFIGHGRGPDAGDGLPDGEGAIALADDNGRPHLLSASDLGMLLAAQPSLRLAVLNSCEGAQSGERDLFASTAAMLVLRGIPAVLAMQYEITDRAAIQFGSTFYRALASGIPIDVAATEARKAVKLEVRDSPEWGTPVLFMRSPNGQIFDIAAGAAAPLAPDAGAPAPAAAP